MPEMLFETVYHHGTVDRSMCVCCVLQISSVLSQTDIGVRVRQTDIPTQLCHIGHLACTLLDS